jgi:hypothetical protein
MEELFRFQVIRPATRSVPATVTLDRPLEPPPERPAPPRLDPVGNRYTSTLPAFVSQRVNLGLNPTATATQASQGFQDQLRHIVQGFVQDRVGASAIWKSLEPIALDFVVHQAQPILTNSLWLSLRNSLDKLRTLTPDKLVPELKRQTLDRETLPRLASYKFDLGDLFIALLIIRRGGPSNLDTIIRSQQLWDAAELLSDNPTLQEIADHINLIDLIVNPDVLNAPSGTKPADVAAIAQQAFQTAMSRTLLIPRGIFAPLEKPTAWVGGNFTLSNSISAAINVGKSRI